MSDPGILPPNDVLDLRPPEAKVRDKNERLRAKNERLRRQIEILQLATLRLQCELAAAEKVIEAGRHYRNDYGARDLDEAIREYDKVNS